MGSVLVPVRTKRAGFDEAWDVPQVVKPVKDCDLDKLDTLLESLPPRHNIVNEAKNVNEVGD